MKSPELPQLLYFPPPPEIPPNLIPTKVGPASVLKEVVKQKGSKGKRVSVLTNHFKVNIERSISDFYQYDVSILTESGHVASQKNVRMAVIEKLCEMYKSQLSGKQIFYDGARIIFAAGPLPQNNLEFTVVINDILKQGCTRIDEELCGGSVQKKQWRTSCSKLFKVEIKFVAVISTQSLKQAVCGERLRDNGSLRVLDAILRQQASKRGCLVVRQSFFSNELTNFIDLGGGIQACRGFFSSFKALQGGLYLNHDVALTTVIQPGPIIDFLLSNQNAKNPSEIDWTKANLALRHLRMNVKHLRREFKITGLSDKSCKEQKFSLRLDDTWSIETTVYDYFVHTKGINLSFSANLPCINAGKSRNPIFFPVELCSLVPLQCKVNELYVYQKSAMIAKSSLKPEDLIKILSDAVNSDRFDVEPILKSCGISINKALVQTQGRVLPSPRLKVGNGEHIVPRNGWWNVKDKRLIDPKKMEHWAVVNFSSQFDVRTLCQKLAQIGSRRGMVINPPLRVLDENPKHKKKPPSVRVDLMFHEIQSRFRQDPPRFILCLLDKKPSHLYGPWKKKTLIEFGIRNQCLRTNRTDDNYLMNVILKINVKLGGFNHVLAAESTRTVPLVGTMPTMIFGMDVSHSSLAQTDGPSIASVVGSREWPKISSYKASLRAIPTKAHMIDSLFKPKSQVDDTGIMRELLLDFYGSSGQQKPAQIIIFRNGLSSSEFNQVLNAEMDQILEACKFLEENWRPKFTVIVSQRRHHTKIFDDNSSGNVAPGTIIDDKICDVEFTNFYMCPHASRLGTSRPIHYHVPLDEIGFSSDDLQELIHSLSYAFQRCNSSISEVAPIRYARLVAAQMLQIIKPDKMANSSENRGGYGPGYQLPMLHENISSSMFFC